MELWHIVAHSWVNYYNSYRDMFSITGWTALPGKGRTPGDFHSLRSSAKEGATVRTVTQIESGVKDLGRRAHPASG